MPHLAGAPMAKVCKYDGAEISVVKWEEYQCRKDAKTVKWFKIDNDIVIGSALYGMNCEHKWLFIYILSMTAKKMGKSFTWNSDYVEAVTGVKGPTQEQAIDLLIQKGTIQCNFNDTNVLESNISSTCLEREKERKKEEREEKESCERSFEPLAAAFAGDSFFEKTFTERSVTRQVQDSWVEAFPDIQWIRGEIAKALSWEASNPNRRKKNFGAFITRWLTKSWDQRKTNPGTGIDWSGFGGAA